MQKYIFAIMVDANPGQDDALNKWLDDIHIPEVLQTKEFVGATRFERVDEAPDKQRYLHFYEIETDDIDAVKAALAEGNASRSPLSPALNRSNMFTAFYKQRT
jgi:hypothetical protein